MAEERTLILVLGMHRSGTSVLTRVLNLLGADVGRDLLAAQKDINARGFWEHRELVAINEKLLSAVGRSWYDFLPLPSSLWSGEAIAGLQEQAVTFLGTAFAEDATLAVIKDPRLCLLLPFWESAAKQAGWKPVVILATRSPAEVAASLCRRDPLTQMSADLLWLRYTEDSERYSRELPRLCVDYAGLLADWKAVMGKVSKALGMDWPVDIHTASEAISQAIDPGLRHQREVEEHQGELADLTRQAWQSLQLEKPDLQALDEVWQAFDRLLGNAGELADNLAATNRRLVAVNNELQALGEDHRKALEVVAEKDDQLQKLAHELTHAHAVIEERDRQITELSGELEYARSVVEERDAQLHKLAAELEHAVSIVEQRDAQLNHTAVKIVRKLFSVDKQ
ncbi:hypothetical protein [Thiolapillus sp.]